MILCGECFGEVVMLHGPIEFTGGGDYERSAMVIRAKMRIGFEHRDTNGDPTGCTYRSPTEVAAIEDEKRLTNNRLRWAADRINASA